MPFAYRPDMMPVFLSESRAAVALLGYSTSAYKVSSPSSRVHLAAHDGAESVLHVSCIPAPAAASSAAELQMCRVLANLPRLGTCGCPAMMSAPSRETERLSGAKGTLSFDADVNVGVAVLLFSASLMVKKYTAAFADDATAAVVPLSSSMPFAKETRATTLACTAASGSWRVGEMSTWTTLPPGKPRVVSSWFRMGCSLRRKRWSLVT